MLLDTGCIIPIEEARRDFSQVIRLADRFGAAVIIQDAPGTLYGTFPGRKTEGIWQRSKKLLIIVNKLSLSSGRNERV